MRILIKIEYKACVGKLGIISILELCSSQILCVILTIREKSGKALNSICHLKFRTFIRVISRSGLYNKKTGNCLCKLVALKMLNKFLKNTFTQHLFFILIF